jgi:AraC-like DNA-binding protein
MAATSTRTFSDPGDFQAGFGGATIDLVFTRPGIFSARLTSVSLPGLKLLSVQESLARIAYISLAPETTNFTFSTRSQPPPIWGGVEMKSQDLMFHSVGERMHQRTGGASSCGTISFDPKFFATASKALIGSELIPPRVGRVFRCSQPDAVELRRLHAKACRLAETKPKTFAHREVARAIEHDIVYALVNCLTADVVHEDTFARRRRAIVMNRFEDVLAAKSHRQLPLPQLCKAIRAPERSLRQYCFELLGMSPNQYIRLRRLNLVHVALQDADPATENVAKTARRYGFSELGRFAAVYRSVFGENPSTTLWGGVPHHG